MTSCSCLSFWEIVWETVPLFPTDEEEVVVEVEELEGKEFLWDMGSEERGDIFWMEEVEMEEETVLLVDKFKFVGVVVLAEKEEASKYDVVFKLFLLLLWCSVRPSIVEEVKEVVEFNFETDGSIFNGGAKEMEEGKVAAVAVVVVVTEEFRIEEEEGTGMIWEEEKGEVVDR